MYMYVYTLHLYVCIHLLYMRFDILMRIRLCCIYFQESNSCINQCIYTTRFLSLQLLDTDDGKSTSQDGK